MSPDMSFDQSARFLARHLGRLLPGKPAVDARFVSGAAGLVAAANLARAPADGSTLALLSPNVIQASALGLTSGRFDARTLTWIGGLTNEEWACVQMREKTSAPQGLSPRTHFFLGTLGAGSRSDVHARAFAGVESLRLTVIPGYANRGELARALESLAGELACAHASEAEIAEIRALHFEMLAHHARGELAGYFRYNQLIHLKIIEASGNAVLTNTYRQLNANVRRARYMANLSQERWDAAVAEHEEILAALARRDAARLKKLLAEHLAHKVASVMAALAENAAVAA